jgi:hypothetical protein
MISMSRGTAFALIMFAFVASAAPAKARINAWAVPMRVVGDERFFLGRDGQAWAVNLKTWAVRTVRSASAKSQVWDVNASGLLVSDPGGLHLEAFAAKTRQLVYPTRADQEVHAATFMTSGIFLIVSHGKGTQAWEHRFVDATGEPRLLSTTYALSGIQSSPPRAVGNTVYWVQRPGSRDTLTRWTVGDQEPVGLGGASMIDVDAAGVWVMQGGPFSREPGPDLVWRADDREKTLTELFDPMAFAKVWKGMLYVSTPRIVTSDWLGTRTQWPRIYAYPVGCKDRREAVVLAKKVMGDVQRLDIAHDALQVAVIVTKSEKPLGQYTEVYSLPLSRK